MQKWSPIRKLTSWDTVDNMNKDLKDKAIDIRGKKYVQVSSRVIFFNETYPKGSIHTEWISSEPEMVVIKATVYPDGHGLGTRSFTAYSQATWGDGMVNKTAALENAETSAVGRALGFMGIGVIDSIASIDEINKAQTQTPYQKKAELRKNPDFQAAKNTAELDVSYDDSI